MFTNVITAIGSGTAMTLALLYVMQFLISLSPVIVPDTRDPAKLGWVRVPPPEDPPRTDDPVVKRDDLKPPVPPKFTPPGVEGVEPIRVSLGGPEPPRPTHEFQSTFNSDGPLVSVVLVRPVYPPRALTMGIEGYVIVRFDVGADGTVSNVSIVESSHSMFNQSAVDAARRFRYKPRVVNGVPVATPGVQTLLTFQIES